MLDIACDVVRDYGAVGDGVTDVSNAFLNAIEATRSGVIYVPPGVYVLNTQLVITRSGVSMRGSGQNTTTLIFNSSLTDLFGNDWRGGDHWNGSITGKFSQWMNAPGLIRFLGQGPESWQQVTSITKGSLRGSTMIQVAANGLNVGEWITIGQSVDSESHLLKDLNTRPASWPCPACINPVSGNGARGSKTDVLRFHSRILSINGLTLTLERPLPFNISLDWSPKVYRFSKGISDVGIQDLTIQMRWSKYQGHFLEPGFNGIEFSDASSCWVRNLNILNGDTLLSFYRSSFCTADSITTGTTRRRNPATGMECHHGINVSNSQDVLVSNIRHNQKCFHDMTVFNFTVGVAFVNVSGPDLALDHHRFYPYGTLWSNISVGKGSRVFLGGGLTPWGTSASSYTTFWNIHSDHGISSLPQKYDFGSNVNFIGVDWRDPGQVADLMASNSKCQGWKSEVVPAGKALHPAELFGAMIEKRLHP